MDDSKKDINSAQSNESSITKKLKYVKPLIESFSPKSAYGDGCNPVCNPCGPPSGCPPRRECQPKCNPKCNPKEEEEEEEG